MSNSSVKPSSEGLPFQQLALRLRPADGESFENFYSTVENGALLQQLHLCAESILQPREHRKPEFLWLHGSKSAGKSHLLQALYRKVSQQNVSAYYIPLAELRDIRPAELLEGVVGSDLLCLDDIEVVSGSNEWDKALFNLYNSALLENTSLVFASSKPASELSVGLPDLRSRLMSFGQFAVNALDDDGLLAAMRLRAEAIGLVLSMELAEYIVHRSQRDMGALMSVLNVLDSRSLASKRRLTKPFVKEVMIW